jgi:hypothetical protein
MGLVMFFPRKAIAFEQVGVLSVDDAHSFAHLLLLAGSLGSDSIDLTAHHISFIKIIGLHLMQAFFVSEAPRDYGFWGVLWCVFGHEAGVQRPLPTKD